MLKTRNFFIGLGIGFLTSGLMLSFYGSFNSDNLNGFNNQYTIEELKVIAKKENLYLYTKDELDALLKEHENDNNNQEAVNKNRFYFAIPTGFSTDEVADYLIEVGVLKEKEKFLSILDSENLTTKIIAKTYYFEQELSTEELIEMITNTDSEDW